MRLQGDVKKSDVPYIKNKKKLMFRNVVTTPANWSNNGCSAATGCVRLVVLSFIISINVLMQLLYARQANS